MVRLLLNHPVIFFVLVTLALGVLGSLGLLGSRYGPQLVPAGAIGFAYGISVGGFFAAAFFLLRGVSQSSRWAKFAGLIGGTLILGLFLLLSRQTIPGQQSSTRGESSVVSGDSGEHRSREATRAQVRRSSGA